MKIIALLLTVFLVQVNASTRGQNLTLKSKNVTLRELIRTIQQQTTFNIVYNRESVDLDARIQLWRNDIDLPELLTHMSDKYSISHTIKGKDIVLRRTAPIKMDRDNGIDQTNIHARGKIVDSLQKPIGGVTIRVKGTNRLTNSDREGWFELTDVAKGSLLQISHVAYHNKEVMASADPFVIQLRSRDEISEVVITGYQVIDKRQSTSAVSSIKTKDIAQIGAGSIEEMLQGQLPGLSVVNTSAAPGAAPKIRVRGVTTITGNADPIWVLDGVILENSVPISVADLNNPDVMNSFNSVIGGVSPNDIESITVLKDASATAIYGTRAANGVIVVTTKRGGSGQNRLSYVHSSSIEERPSYSGFNLLNSKERVLLTQQAFEDGMTISGNVGMEYLIGQYALGNLSPQAYQEKVNILESRNTDWFKLLFRNAYSQTHNLSTSGGSEKMDYYISLNHNGQQGADKTSNYKSYSGFSKANMELFRGVNLETVLQIGRRDRENFHSSIDPFQYAIRTSRTIPVYGEDGNLFFYRSTHGEYYNFNILNELNSTHRESTQTDLKGTLNLKAELFKGLTFSSLYSYSSSNSSAIDYAKEQSYYIAGIRGYDFGEADEEKFEKSKLPYGGIYDEQVYAQRAMLFRNGLEYKARFSDLWNVDGLVGQEFRTTDYQGTNLQGYGYMHDRGNIFYDPTADSPTGHLSRNRIMRNIPKRSYISYYAVLSSMFDDRFVLNGNIRFDGSNLFGSNPKYRYLPLWSLSGKWIVSNESFLKNNNTISNLAIRGSYGLRGNIVEDSSPQIIASALPPNASNGLLEMAITQAPNPNLKWETTTSLNVGLEFGLFKNRLTAVVDYYRDYSRDLIAYKDISAVSGFMAKYVNYADVKNQGIDVAVTGQIIKKDNFSWISTLNLGFVKNEVMRASITPQAANLVRSIYTPGEVYLGKPVNGMFSYRFANLDEKGLPLFYDADNNLLGAKDPNIAEDILNNIDNLAYEGTRDPLINGGFNNMVRYGNFSLSFLFSFGLKNVVRLPALAYNSHPYADENANQSILERWRKEGDEASTTIPAITGGSGYFSTESGTFYTTDLYNKSQESIVPGDYLRLRNLMLEYRVPSHILQRIGIRGRNLQGVSIKLQGQNLYTLKSKRLKGYDPETINFTTSRFGAMPLLSSYTFGININL